MKRRIDISNLQSLSEEQKQKLRDWWKPQDGDWFYGCHCNDQNDGCPCEFETKKELILSPYIVDCGHYGASLTESPPSKEALPLLDISMMIELLGWQCLETVCIQMYCSESEPELCDFLFKRIKEAL